MTWHILHGDCLDVMRNMDDNSIDFIVTDPPYALTGKSGKGGFMGKEWDSHIPGGTNNTDDNVCGKFGSVKALQQNSHPCIKPLSLMKYIIKLLAPPGNPILLDPFMGSGSTLIAAKELGISAIGIEKESEYCEIAEKRIAAAKQPEPDLFDALGANKTSHATSE